MLYNLSYAASFQWEDCNQPLIVGTYNFYITV